MFHAHGTKMKDLRIRPPFEAAEIERGEPFEFNFAGQPVTAYLGETIGTALTAAGITTFRVTRQGGRPRGIFCGIGICFDCLVVVEGRLNQRACLTPARPGLEVQPQAGAGHLEPEFGD
ncbi:MAG: (2Fe-2S)-binding protein [Chloroflexi bacterium]|jgi:predicted molibdopterin-dependent oxidoreductase YjgC|nr:(2Fe-2S)-binding protein [Chloroflexota bacterium]